MRGGPAPDRVFVALALLFGSVLLLAIGPLQAPDESEHFYRAYEISEGRWVPERRPGPSEDPDRLVNVTGGDLPRSLAAIDLVFDPVRLRPTRRLALSTVEEAFRIPLTAERRRFVLFSNAAMASPLAYLPQASGIALARPLTDSALALVYAGRAANLLAATLLVALAIRIAPLARWGFVVLALTPTMLAQSASLSSDSLTNSLCFLFVALVLRGAYGPGGRASMPLLGVLLLVGAGLGLVKQMYLALPLAVWAIPAARLGGRRRAVAFLVLLLGVTGAATAAWGVIGRRIFSPLDPLVDPDAQLAYLFAHPFSFPATIGRTLSSDGPVLLEEYLGVLGTLDTRLPPLLLGVHGMVLLLVAGIGCSAIAPVGRRERLVAIAVALVVAVNVCVSNYLIACPVAAERLWLQGRYFVPVGPLALWALWGLFGVGASWPPRTRAWLAWCWTGYLCGALALTSWTAATRYFHGGAAAWFEQVALDSAFREAGRFDELARWRQSATPGGAQEAGALYARAAQAEEAGHVVDAIAGYRAVVGIEGEAPLVARRLAALLISRAALTREEAAEAESLARSACRASGFEDPRDLEVLAAALAAQGRRGEARRVLRVAIAQAWRAGAEDLARALEERLGRYRAGGGGAGPSQLP